MGILNIIRQKSDSQKKLFSLVMAIVLTLVIVFVWYSFTSTDSGQIAGEPAPKTLSSLSPLQVIKDEFSKAYSSITGKVSDPMATDTVPIEIVAENILATSTDETATSTIN